MPAAAVATPEAPGAVTRGRETMAVKVDTGKLDFLADMAGELVIAESLVRHDPDLAGVQSQTLQRKISMLTRITADGITANLGAAGAIDMALSRNSQFLYALSGGSHAIVGFTVSSDGSLTPIANGAASVPSGVNGLVAR